MTSLDFLYICLAIGFISLCVFINMVLYQVLLTVKTARTTLEHIHSYTKDAVNMKDNLKLNALKGVQKVISIFKRD
jgi:hypothetical protein